MTRGLATSDHTAEVVRPVALLYLDLPSGAIRVNSSDRTISYGGNDYTGVGNLGAISDVEDVAEVQAANVTVTMSGLNTTLLSSVFTDHYQGRPAIIYLGFLDSSYALTAGGVFELFTGRIDYMELSTDESTSAITCHLENELVDWERPNVLRFNNETQQMLYAGDKGLEYVEQMVENEIKWGR